MNEREWIERVLARFRIPIRPGRVGVGDDCAVITPREGLSTVLTVDTMVEDTHFRRAWLSEPELGSRALRVSLSDLAAMAARPVGALISIETPELPGLVGDGFWDGVAATASDFGFEILGGNVTRTSGPVSIATTLIGEVETGREVLRSGAQPGDGLWVSGQPGAAAVARELLDRGERGDGTLPYRCPESRIDLALELNGRGVLKAAIDISDGLGLDATRLLAASGCGGTLNIAPLRHRVAHCLDGGDDYELLMALSGDVEHAGLTRIGTVESAPGLRVENGSETLDYTAVGWDPFRM